MQRDTSPANCKVGAPVFQRIVVSTENHHFPPWTFSQWETKGCRHFRCIRRSSSKVKPLVEVEKTGAGSFVYFFFFWSRIQGMLCPLRQEVRKKPHYSLWFWLTTLWVPSGVLRAPATSRLLQSHADKHGSAGNQRQMWARASAGHQETGRAAQRWRGQEWWAADGASLRSGTDQESCRQRGEGLKQCETSVLGTRAETINQINREYWNNLVIDLSLTGVYKFKRRPFDASQHRAENEPQLYKIYTHFAFKLKNTCL